MNRVLPAVLLACAFPLPGAIAQPVPRDQRTQRLLVGDTTLDGVYLAEDLNGDGDADDAGETRVYFDASNASGLFNPTGLVAAIAGSLDGAVYVADTDSDSVYRLVDLNADGDANDQGEATLFFGPGNYYGYLNQTPNGLALHASGDVFLCTAGASASTSDAVFRLRDLNADGDAMDENEAKLWFDLGSLVASSSPFALALLGDALFVNDLRGSFSDQVMRAFDADASNSIDAGEFTGYADASVLGVSLGLGLAGDGADLYTVENVSSSQNRLHRLLDADASGQIDPGEATAIWSRANAPGATPPSTVFDLALGPGTLVAVGSDGSDAQDNVYYLTDLDADGDYLDAGETVVFLTGHGAGVFPDRIRSIGFLPPPPPPPGCDPDYDQNGVADQDDVSYLIDVVAGGNNPTGRDPDFDQNGVADQDDVAALVNVVAGGACP